MANQDAVPTLSKCLYLTPYEVDALLTTIDVADWAEVTDPVIKDHILTAREVIRTRLTALKGGQ